MPVDNSPASSFAPADVDHADLAFVWDRFLKIIREHVKPLPVMTWFEPIRPLSLQNDHLKVQLPNAFFYDWLEEHYNATIQTALTQVLGPTASLTYEIAQPDLFDGFDKHPSVAPSVEPAANEYDHKQLARNIPPSEEPQIDHDELYRASFLNPRYTFDNFIRGDGNQFARAAAMNVANNPGLTSFNPLVIYGGVGLGKTHLLQAIGNASFQNKKATKIIYLSSEMFTVQFVDAIENNKTKEFSDFFRSMDILIIDDIQFLSGKEKTQENFFHTFNTLHQLKKQIVLSSDRAPKEIRGFDERLISRFLWGVTVDIQPPDLETRIAILQMRSDQDNITIPREVVEFVASNIKTNIRELEGCYYTMIARHMLDQRPLDLALAEEALRKVTSSVQKQITVEQIQKIVAEFFNISENLLRAKTRKQEIAFARQIAMYLAKNFTSASLKTIGLHFGGRDHSTVIHACQTISAAQADDPDIKEKIQQIEKQISLTHF